jgi:FdhD protein
MRARAPDRLDAAAPPEAVVETGVARWEHGAFSSACDRIAVEEPLEIRIAGEPLAVTMRTPGHDHELTVGFLFGEGLVTGARDLGSVVHCGHPGEEGYGNVMDVTSAPGTVLDVDRHPAVRRGTLTTSACGVCGRSTIDDLLARCGAVTDESRFPARLVATFPDALRREQPVFAETGGLHAAGIATASGRFLAVREDVGRHNAVDKVIGRLLLDGALPRPGLALVVSGRTSFEIVQKAVTASIPLVVSVSAPSSLAIDVAERTGLTLVGFTRQGSFNVYCHEERLEF